MLVSLSLPFASGQQALAANASFNAPPPVVARLYRMRANSNWQLPEEQKTNTEAPAEQG